VLQVNPKQTPALEVLDILQAQSQPSHVIIPAGTVLIPDGDNQALGVDLIQAHPELKLVFERWVEVFIKSLGLVVSNLKVATTILAKQVDPGIRVLTSLCSQILCLVQIDSEATIGVVNGNVESAGQHPIVLG